MKKYLLFVVAILAMLITTSPATAEEIITFEPAECAALSGQYRVDSEAMSFGQMDALRNCISTMVQMKADQIESEKADKAIVKLYGLNGR